MAAKSMSVTITVSTDPRFDERYFIDVRDTTGGRNIQMTTRHADADAARDLVSRITAEADRRDIAVTTLDRTCELYEESK